MEFGISESIGKRVLTQKLEVVNAKASRLQEKKLKCFRTHSIRDLAKFTLLQKVLLRTRGLDISS